MPELSVEIVEIPGAPLVTYESLPMCKVFTIANQPKRRFVKAYTGVLEVLDFEGEKTFDVLSDDEFKEMYDCNECIPLNETVTITVGGE